MRKFLVPVFVGIAIFVLVIFGFEIFGEYLANHQYYFSMFKGGWNISLVIRSLIWSLIPLSYVFFSKKFKLKYFISWLFLWLMFFSLIHVDVKAGTNILNSGRARLVKNTFFLFGLGAYFTVWVTALGTLISEKVLKLKESRRQEMLISFGLWLWWLLMLVRYLIQAQVFFSILTWILFLALAFVVFLQRKTLSHYWKIISEIFENINLKNLQQSNFMTISLVLLAISLMYYLFGFQLSFIPYSTAWDANHAYMYFPKVRSLNNGAFWQNWPGGGFVGLWHTFIAFWFSLKKPFGSSGLAPDTIAVAMNFLSWIYVMVLWIGLIKEVISYFTKKTIKKFENNQLFNWVAFNLWWFILLLWLTSGMWAFLVFVDNKTDLGVMAMTILAILSGFIFLKYIKDHSNDKNSFDKEAIKYLLISGFMFALASIAKMTAFFDIALFGLLLIGLWFGAIFGIGWWVFLLWLLGQLKFGNIRDFIPANSPLAITLMIIGGVMIIIGIANIFLRNSKTTKNRNFKSLIKYLGIRVLGLVATILIGKGPGVIYYNAVVSDGFGISDMVKQLIFTVKSPTYLLTNSWDIWEFKIQSIADEKVLKTDNIEQCKTISYTEEELKKDLKDAIVKNEDVGRYIGYWRKEFKKPESKVFTLWYNILRLFFHKDWSCYAFSKDVKKLCEARTAIDSFDVNILTNLKSELNPNKNSYKLISVALDNFKEKWYSATDPNLTKFMRDEIINLRQYYQWNSVFSSEESIQIPYRYLVPLNISYNWSLQNLSSYYTDIGFVWLFMMGFVILSIIYGLIAHNYRLTLLSTVTLIGWVLWRAAGGGILWYGLWMIMRTAIVMVIWTKKMLEYSEKEKKWRSALVLIMISIFAIWWMIQMVFNFVRIASQWAWWPFARYKMWIGEVNEIWNDLSNKMSRKPYSTKDVFDLQFPHYNFMIEYTKDRKDEDWVLIAGTYLSYFLENQKNLKYDWMLTNFRKDSSDNDSCKTYQRLRNGNTKYIVIDPNIWTVVMWEWNETLFNRFFAKINPVSGLVEEHWAISMLLKLNNDWYLKLLNTNNLWAKYAFLLTNSEFTKKFGDLTDEQLLVVKSQLSIARFFPNAQQLIWFIWEIFAQRVQNGKAIWDIADVYWKIIDEQKVFDLSKSIIAQANPYQIQEKLSTLTQDEKLILSQYLWIYNIKQSDYQQFMWAVNQIIQISLWGSSQLISLELLD